MKKQGQEVCTAILLGVLLPGLLLRSAVLLKMLPNRQNTLRQQPISPTTESIETPPQGLDKPLPVLLADGSLVEMDTDEYLVGVLLKEMPASFAQEAKKAQSVVARTYALRVHEKGEKHEQGAVCTDYTCCQAYIDPAEYLEEGGKQEAIDAARQAVEETHGMVLTYDGKLIDATYFSCSGGYTEDAVAVWGTDVPYLQSVSSPGEEYATHYTDTVQFSVEEFAEALGMQAEELGTNWLGELKRTQGGGVDTLEIGDTTFQGTELRKLLNLRSTAFYITAVGDTVTITTRGYGHRVGMSQYGADAMAAEGYTYEEILCHYYLGTTLERYEESSG